MLAYLILSSALFNAVCMMLVYFLFYFAPDLSIVIYTNAVCLIIIIIMDIFKCYFSGEQLSIKK